MKAKTFVAYLPILLTFVIMYSFFVEAVPLGPGIINKGTPDRRTLGVDNITGGTQIQAQAGNVTSLKINSTRLSSRWQGYYGNVTGSITLDDANNNTLYSWDFISPRGEVYAANDSVVTWAKVYCFNYTANLSNDQGGARIQGFNGTELESMIGASITDADSANRTFNATFGGSFQVGAVTFGSTSGCRQTTLYVSDAYQTTDFVEVLLTDNSSIIFTSILEQDQTGFGGSTLDFEMIVGENGDFDTATPYYFFVELS